MWLGGYRDENRVRRRKWSVTRSHGGLLALVVVLLVAWVLPSEAHRGGFGHRGVRHGFRGGFIGAHVVVPLWPYWGHYRPVYSYPVVSPAPIISVQPVPQVIPPPAPAYWYYCTNPEGYYPYVSQCPDGWRPVTPTPPQ